MHPTRELPESLSQFIRRRPEAILTAIRSEASRRRFFRIRFGKKCLVAMVYPEPAPAEVERFCAVQKIYGEHGLRAPRIDMVLGDQVVIQEDAGDLLLQRAWRLGSGRERERLLNRPLQAEMGDGFFSQAFYRPSSRPGKSGRGHADRPAPAGG
jgi:aminoglycoside/choline kinase family phosphotransferase